MFTGILKSANIQRQLACKKKKIVLGKQEDTSQDRNNKDMAQKGRNKHTVCSNSTPALYTLGVMDTDFCLETSYVGFHDFPQLLHTNAGDSTSKQATATSFHVPSTSSLLFYHSKLNNICN